MYGTLILYLSAALNTIDHKILLTQLCDEVGISSAAHQCFVRTLLTEPTVACLKALFWALSSSLFTPLNLAES